MSTNVEGGGQLQAEIQALSRGREELGEQYQVLQQEGDAAAARLRSLLEARRTSTSRQQQQPQPGQGDGEAAAMGSPGAFVPSSETSAPGSSGVEATADGVTPFQQAALWLRPTQAEAADGSATATSRSWSAGELAANSSNNNNSSSSSSRAISYRREAANSGSLGLAAGAGGGVTSGQGGAVAASGPGGVPRPLARTSSSSGSGLRAATPDANTW